MQIDLNADLGEGFGPWRVADDDALVGLVSSANVACGFHAGDPTTARRTCAAALAAGTTVGAHVGYRDLVGFGRRFVDVDPAELTDDVVYQVGALVAVARAVGARVAYVKPHGALYNAIIHHEEQARAVAEAVALVDPALPLLTLPQGEARRAAERAGLRVVAEAFADRAYAPDGTLVPRGRPDAVLDDPVVVARRVVDVATTGSVVAVDGTRIRLDVETVCLHGDTPGAVASARAVREALDARGVTVASFA